MAGWIEQISLSTSSWSIWCKRTSLHWATCPAAASSFSWLAFVLEQRGGDGEMVNMFTKLPGRKNQGLREVFTSLTSCTSFTAPMLSFPGCWFQTNSERNKTRQKNSERKISTCISLWNTQVWGKRVRCGANMAADPKPLEKSHRLKFYTCPTQLIPPACAQTCPCCHAPTTPYKLRRGQILER